MIIIFILIISTLAWLFSHRYVAEGAVSHLLHLRCLLNKRIRGFSCNVWSTLTQVCLWTEKDMRVMVKNSIHSEYFIIITWQSLSKMLTREWQKYLLRNLWQAYSYWLWIIAWKSRIKIKRRKYEVPLKVTKNLTWFVSGLRSYQFFFYFNFISHCLTKTILMMQLFLFKNIMFFLVFSIKFLNSHIALATVFTEQCRNSIQKK